MTEQSATMFSILAELKKHPGETISGNNLAASLGISRTAVWKHIRALRARGYLIESRAKKGYCLAAPSQSLRHEEVLPLLRTRFLGRPYEYHEVLASTNDRAMDLARRGAPHGTTVVAEEQTAGRGRLRRPWVSPRGMGVYVSMILRPDLPPRQGPETTLVTALALAHALRTRWALDARIKWPNDVLINGKKVAGILTEMQSDPDRIQFLVVGVGINVLQGEKDLPTDVLYPATSVAVEWAKASASVPLMGAWEQSRAHVLATFLNSMEELYGLYLQEGLGPLREDLKKMSAVLGKTVRIQVSDGVVEGLARDLTDRGALVVETPCGILETIWVGDIVHLREADGKGPDAAPQSCL